MDPSPGRTDGRAARWAGQRERRRHEFVEAALRAIEEYGPEVSIERIAEGAGAGRTRLYRYFTDSADLQAAIADRAVELLTEELAPLWTPKGSALEMIGAAIEAHTTWLAEHGNLYRYLSLRSLSGRDAIADVKTTIGQYLTVMFEYYLNLFGSDTRAAEPVAFAVVGLVESTTARWLANPGDLTRDELAALLARWVWRLLDDTLRAGGVELDPEQPLPVP